MNNYETLSKLSKDELIELIEIYSKNRPEVIALLDKYSHKKIHIFKSCNETDEFLNTL